MIPVSKEHLKLKKFQTFLFKTCFNPIVLLLLPAFPYIFSENLIGILGAGDLNVLNSQRQPK